MENNRQTNIQPTVRKVPWYQRWYSFNKQKIPMIFALIGTLIITGSLDFSFKPASGDAFIFNSHFYALKRLSDTTYNNLAAIAVFIIYLLSIIQLFNTVTFAKKRSPGGVFLMSFITVLLSGISIFYTTIYYREQRLKPTYVMSDVAKMSYTIFLIGSTLILIGTIFAWFYVNWKYVKEKE
ncbi:MAG: hypothetical protein PHW40_08120 [Candidatus Izemoplasmatales bacterium]|nr:hypothetical protein [Candidatus Izemoplasmatales bacterium]MDD5294252.1 hypothetical protein [Candidatus Izemoplasmatales bacterium]